MCCSTDSARAAWHRDFKPDNVMIRTDGRVLVMDFGLAFSDVGRVSSKPDLGELQLDVEISGSTSKLSEHVTATGTLMGTPAYMAPEQFLGLICAKRGTSGSSRQT